MDNENNDFEPCLLVIPFRKHTFDEMNQIADFLSRMGYHVQKRKCQKSCKDREQIIKIGESQ
jgi:hypothetical protein